MLPMLRDCQRSAENQLHSIVHTNPTAVCKAWADIIKIVSHDTRCNRVDACEVEHGLHAGAQLGALGTGGGTDAAVT